MTIFLVRGTLLPEYIFGAVSVFDKKDVALGDGVRGPFEIIKTLISYFVGSDIGNFCLNFARIVKNDDVLCLNCNTYNCKTDCEDNFFYLGLLCCVN